VAFNNCTSPSASSTSMVSTSELAVVVSVDTADLVRFISSSSLPRSGSRPGRRESSPKSAACIAVLRPWTEPCAMWREPRCHSPLSSRKCTRRREEVALPARPPRRGPYSCVGPHRAAVPGTSRCLHGVVQQDVNIH
jgi:hypothetical protein